MVTLVAVSRVAGEASGAMGDVPFHKRTSHLRMGTVRVAVLRGVYSPTRSRKKNARVTRSASARSHGLVCWCAWSGSQRIMETGRASWGLGGGSASLNLCRRDAMDRSSLGWDGLVFRGSAYPLCSMICAQCRSVFLMVSPETCLPEWNRPLRMATAKAKNSR